MRRVLAVSGPSLPSPGYCKTVRVAGQKVLCRSPALPVPLNRLRKAAQMPLL